MSNYLLIFTLLAVPVLLYPLKIFRKGLVTGLFISLTFWGVLAPVLMLVPLGVCAYLFFSAKKGSEAKGTVFYVKSRALPKLTVFLLSMTIFFAFSEIFYEYGISLSISQKILAASRDLRPLALLLGPILAGSWCDRKGPFSACIVLALFSELSVLLAGSGGESAALYLLGNFLIALCISGFFVVMPTVCRSFFGETSFYRFYLPIAANAGLLWMAIGYFYETKWAAVGNPGELLMSLVFLILMSTFFGILAWNTRLTLVRPPKAAEKTGS